jgi:hypothetical protein
VIRPAATEDASSIAALFRRSSGALTFLSTLHTPDQDRRNEAWAWREHESILCSRYGCTATRLVEDWERLVHEVGDYPPSIDDYTNELTGRDGLALLLDWPSPAWRDELRQRVEAADGQYRESTVEDGGSGLERFFRVDASSG